MNRREAIAALVALPEIARISTAPVGPQDVIVVETGLHSFVSEVTRQYITDTLQRVWPGRQIVVLSAGMTLKVLTKGDA